MMRSLHTMLTLQFTNMQHRSFVHSVIFMTEIFLTYQQQQQQKNHHLETFIHWAQIRNNELKNKGCIF